MMLNFFNVILIMFLAITSINCTMEPHSKATQSSPTTATNSPSLQQSIPESNYVVEETYSNGRDATITKQFNGRTETEDDFGDPNGSYVYNIISKKKHPNGSVYRYHGQETMTLLNGTIHLVLDQLIDEDPSCPKYSKMKATIYGTPTVLTEDDPNYIPTPYAELPAGSVVGSFLKNYYTGEGLGKYVTKQVKFKTIAFPGGSFISEDDEKRTLVEYHTEEHSLSDLIISGNSEKDVTLTTTPKAENPYDVTPRPACKKAKSIIVINPIAILAKNGIYGSIKVENPNEKHAYHYRDQKETTLLDGTIHIIMGRVIGENRSYPKHSKIQATIYGTPTILTEDDPNYIPTPYAQLPAGSIVGSFNRNYYTGKTSQKKLVKQTKVKTIGFPDGSFISENDEHRTLVEYDTKSRSLLHRIVLGKAKKYVTLTTTSKAENPYDVIPRPIYDQAQNITIVNPIAQILRTRTKK